MTCLTVTPTTAAEAVDERAELIVSHHPVLFRAVKRVGPTCPATAPLWTLARAGVAIASPHTAFDNTAGRDQRRPRPPARAWSTSARSGRRRRAATFKVVVFTPEADREAVLAAAFAAGAGRIGAYSECSFATRGGTFFGTEGTNPAVGQAGRRETVRELAARDRLPGRSARPPSWRRSAPAIPTRSRPSTSTRSTPTARTGRASGRIGRLAEPGDLGRLRRPSSARRSGTSRSRSAGDPAGTVERVAIVCGAGTTSWATPPGRRRRPLTGEARFHRALEAEALGIGLVVGGPPRHRAPGRRGPRRADRRGLPRPRPSGRAGASATRSDSSSRRIRTSRAIGRVVTRSEPARYPQARSNKNPRVVPGEE